MTDRCRLYLITPPKLDLRNFAETLKRAVGAGDVASLQLRLKGVSDDEVRRTVEILMPVAQHADVAFILNDRPDLAYELRWTACMSDRTIELPRCTGRMGRDCIVGVTCHNSRHPVRRRKRRGRVGAFFRPTKRQGDGRDRDLRWWAEMMVVPASPSAGSRSTTPNRSSKGRGFLPQVVRCVGP